MDIIFKGDAVFEKIALLKKRSDGVNRDVTRTVSEIISDVAKDGDAAVKKYTEKFDKKAPAQLEVPVSLAKEAAKKADPFFLKSLEEAAENIREFHARQLPKGYTVSKNGAVTGQKIRGLKRVGLYVPGGTAAYPSTVLMNAIPAKVAGVSELIMVTPPSRDGNINPDILTAAYVAGVDRIFAMGGAQAVAALAYGTESVPKVDKIVGPGNIFVATAKREVYGKVDIDMIAGPSEILIVADKSANPKFVAADMLSQAEHDRLASAILVTDSESLAVCVSAELERQLSYLERSEFAREALSSSGAIFVLSDIEKCIEVANDFAPEHLELALCDAQSYLDRIENAGSVFVGEFSPEPLGDYFAGPNHVLPTSGTARFFSPLSTDDFLKKTQFIHYTREALLKVKDNITAIAAKEGLTAHANSITVRFEDENV
ncbi:MAG: histidinol dehydrogenase [Clostridia bacterium]|nr:histidinol dehydrogenase [Clostridia bacterium]